MASVAWWRSCTTTVSYPLNTASAGNTDGSTTTRSVRSTRTRSCLPRFCHGFGAVRVEGVHSVYVTLAWIVSEWLRDERGVRRRLLRLVLYPYLKRKARTSTEHVHSLASAYRAIAVRLPSS